eukprot:CAMPEP_0119020340 /NCGR_PEP_ID=MMETSP1176-20130426/23835_1 /TAXON_ID=265551 /ORGANISM="Synedropsis recta cf, Strain CCMP1620" /LENGTH=328 /DNA_ID=CAMNT_0006974753 /DNA_START=75 /DNA_END=1061 /DNA_ORIENTATION=-
MGGSSSKPIKYLAEFENNLPSLENKVVAITGCTSGTGLVAAKVTARKGATTILLLNRPSPRAENAEKEVRAEIPEGAKTTVETIPCDLQDFDSVRSAVKQIKSKYEAVDVLCNNAGVMAMDDLATKDGYDVQMQTNHLSHFLLTKELFPLLQKAKELRGEARIANHSSMARTGGLLKPEFFGKNGGNLGGNGGSMLTGGGGNWERYHQSKLANAVFTLALNDKLKDSGIKATCAAPGYSMTSLQTTSQGMNGAMWTTMMAQSAEDGTMPILQACYGAGVESGDFWEPTKRGHTVGPAGKVDLAKECTDEESRKMLWETSEEACGKWSL